MNKDFTQIGYLPEALLPILSDEDAEQKWSYVNIYSLQDLKDIYLISQLTEVKTVKEITKKVNGYFSSKKKWEERKTLEYLNGLVKFQLLEPGYIRNREYFKNSKINEELSAEDIAILETVFFTYFRFKELSSWFISPTKEAHRMFNIYSASDYVNNSNPLYYCSEKNRFTDTFFQDVINVEKKFVITNDTLMRFWDVYLKWGTTLNILDRFNISQTGEKTIFGNKEVSIVYFIKPFYEFDLIEFIKCNFNSRQVWIPELIHKIVKRFRFSVNEIKIYLAKEARHNSQLTFERTSEIFLIDGKIDKKKIDSATYLFPKINNSYISHIILRR